MIGRLYGKIIAKAPPQVLIDVNGLGYEVDVPMSTFCHLPADGGTVTLLTHLVVREDALLLYGFASATEREAFRALIRVSGIGPRIALAVLSGMSVDDLFIAVEGDNVGLLTRVPGIGKKTAERLILELKGKLTGSSAAVDTAPLNDNKKDIVGALVALGYSEREANKAVKTLDANISVNDGIRAALQSLSK